LIHWSAYLCIRMNARSLKHRIHDRLCQHKFELEKLERAYRHTVNGKQAQQIQSLILMILNRKKSLIPCRSLNQATWTNNT
jgi:hypothetical protein